MKTLYLECNMGAAGDMLLAALYELLEDKERFRRTMNALHPDLSVTFEPALSCGIAGTHARVLAAGWEEHSHDCQDHGGQSHGHDHSGHDHGCEPHEHAHHHASVQDVMDMVYSFDLPQPVRERAAEVYRLLAAAESRAHGVAVGEVHFHEVGMLDAVADITGVCLLMHLLAVDRVVASPVNLGSGHVHTAHGVLPVPAPATAALLEGVPAYMSEVPGELCTPTGAALLRSFAQSFGPMPLGTVQGVGCGMGSKQFDRANCLRAFLCEDGTAEGPNDRVCELRANIDDMTGEALGHAMGRLLAEGALDVFYTPIQMKKNRPAVLLTVLCRVEDGDRLAAEVLRHTTTFGVRRTDCARYALTPSRETVETVYGPVRRKKGVGYGVQRTKAEYDDAARAARAHGVPLEDVLDAME